MADEEDAKPTMSAECRVEALPLSGADISIDGLRLRLDIRIVPRAKSDAESTETNPLFRVVTARISRVSAMPAYQWAAVMFGVGVLLVSITLWFAGTGEAPTAPQRSTAAAPVAPPSKARVEPSNSDRAAQPAATPTAPKTPPPVAEPSPTLQPPASHPPPARVQSVDVDAHERPQPPKRPTPPTRTAVVAATPPPEKSMPQPVAQKSSSRADMLDLFEDTK